MVLPALESFIIFSILHNCVTYNYNMWNHITLLLLSPKMMKVKKKENK